MASVSNKSAALRNLEASAKSRLAEMSLRRFADESFVLSIVGRECGGYL